MKHNVKVTVIILVMFLLTQFIGIYVVDYYSSVKVVQGKIIEVEAPDLPFGLETPDLKETGEFNQAFVSILFAFIIAISLLLLLSRFNAAFFLKLWFFVVVVISLGISFNVFLSKLNSFTFLLLTIPISWLIALVLALVLSFVKIYGKDLFVHNLTELFVYPGIAAIFVPILNIYTISLLLILISVYDIWAVWHSGIMQKMAKFQIQKLKIFSGFFVPYVSKKVRLRLKKMKKSELKKKKTTISKKTPH